MFSEVEIEVFEAVLYVVGGKIVLVRWDDVQEEPRLHVFWRTRFLDECQSILVEVDIEFGAGNQDSFCAGDLLALVQQKPQRVWDVVGGVFSLHPR